jgi:transaldolase
MGIGALKISALDDLRVKIFADGANAETIRELAQNPLIKGFTTNPSMMRAAGICNYLEFAHTILKAIGDRPVSFEVVSDELPEMERQARIISLWGRSVYVKIPVTNTRAESTASIVRKLAGDGIKLNVTAVMTLGQVSDARDAIGTSVAAYISLFAGRIADTGVDPVPLVRQAVEMLSGHPNIELIWASPRELLNIFQADAAGCHVITATPELLLRLPLVGKSLDEFSLETVKMFHRDATAANLSL